MKKAYTTPKAYKLDYAYEEQVTALSAVLSYYGGTGTMFKDYEYCQMAVDANKFTTCRYYYTTDELGEGGKCNTDAVPWSLRPW